MTGLSFPSLFLTNERPIIPQRLQAPVSGAGPLSTRTVMFIPA